VWSTGPWRSTVAGLPSVAGILNFTSPCSWLYAVDGAAKDSVGDGVGALGGLPGLVLGWWMWTSSQQERLRTISACG
jgi:hypothetical protein